MAIILKGKKSKKYRSTKKTGMTCFAVQGKRDDLGDDFYRSKWEANYVRYIRYIQENNIPYMEFPDNKYDKENAKKIRNFILTENQTYSIDGYKGAGKLVKKIEYEPGKFVFEGVKQGVVSYRPDFLLTFEDDTEVWVEIKGWMDGNSKTKIRRFLKYYPDHEFDILIQRDYYRIRRNFRKHIPNWE